MLGHHGTVLVGTWWFWVSITWYSLVLSWTGLLQWLYACIYWKIGDWSDVHSGTDGRTRKDRATQPMSWTKDGWDEQFRPALKSKSQLFTCGACQLQSHPSRSSQSAVVLSSSKRRVSCKLRLKTQRSSFKAPPNLGGGNVSSSRHAIDLRLLLVGWALSVTIMMWWRISFLSNRNIS